VLVSNKTKLKPIEFLKSSKDNYDKRNFDNMSIENMMEINDLLWFTCLFRNHIPQSEFTPVDIEKLMPEFSKTFLGYSNRVRSIFNKKKSELIFIKKVKGYLKETGGFSGLVNDIDGGAPFWPTAQPYGNQLVCSINAYELKEYINSDAFKHSTPKYPEKKKALKELADSLGWEDNPVLMVVTLK
jgi:hypothetical protein